ncbi:MAG: hypothetical protein ACOC2L_00400 [Candidatus Sumerlaeota bacterium]
MEREMELEVFRAGDYGRRGRYDEGALDRMAEDYSPERHEAPVTVDHHQEGPAKGWVRGLRRVGDKLIARIGGLAPEFLEQMRGGQFKKRSVELYRAFGETERPYLKAVTFLGAAAPVVKGLADPVFSEETGCEGVAFVESEEAEETTVEESAMSETEEALAVPPDIAAFCEGLEKDGLLSPAVRREGLEAFLASLDGEASRAFGESGEEVTQRAWMEEFLRSRTPAVPFGESAPEERMERPEFGEIAPGRDVAPESIALHERVVMYRRQHPEANYSEALREVARMG